MDTVSAFAIEADLDEVRSPQASLTGEDKAETLKLCQVAPDGRHALSCLRCQEFLRRPDLIRRSPKMTRQSVCGDQDAGGQPTVLDVLGDPIKPHVSRRPLRGSVSRWRHGKSNRLSCEPRLVGWGRED
jgi:hypothetical protein